MKLLPLEGPGQIGTGIFMLSSGISYKGFFLETEWLVFL